MNLKRLPTLVFLLICTCLRLSAQDALFTVTYAGKAGLAASDSVQRLLQQMGAQNGFALQLWQPERLLSPADYPELIVAVEEGDLWQLGLAQRERLAEYLLGGEGRKGAALVVLHLEEPSSPETSRTALRWEWLENLLTPPEEMSFTIPAPEQLPNQASLSVSGQQADKWQGPLLAAFQRVLPHPTPQSPFEGAKVFYTRLSRSQQGFERNDRGQFVQSVWYEVLLNALMWAGDFAEGAQLNIPYLPLRAENELQNVRLDWATALEVENDFFEVMRSSDGIHWKAIGQISAVGNSRRVSYYEFIDTELRPGQYFYRLRQRSRSGSESYSGLVFVDVQRPDPLIHLFPNPVRDQLSVELQANTLSSWHFQIETVTGIVVWEERVEARSVYLNTVAQVDQLPPGVYQFRVRTENGERVRNFVKY